MLPRARPGPGSRPSPDLCGADTGGFIWMKVISDRTRRKAREKRQPTSPPEPTWVGSVLAAASAGAAAIHPRLRRHRLNAPAPLHADSGLYGGVPAVAPG